MEMAKDSRIIRFSLRRNKLYGLRAGQYAAVVRPYRTVGQETLIADMAGRNASVSRQEIIVVLDLMRDVIGSYLLAGDNVKTDLFNARVSIAGGFASVEDNYTPGRHAVRVRMVPAAPLKRSVKRLARVTKIRGRVPAPQIDSLYDYETQAKNGPLSPGFTAEIKGVNLDWDRADEAQGIFFKSPGRSAVKAEIVHKLDRSHAVFKVPALASGAYRLTVRRGFGAELRNGELDYPLTVG
jgi:hypothetical protein